MHCVCDARSAQGDISSIAPAESIKATSKQLRACQAVLNVLQCELEGELSPCLRRPVAYVMPAPYISLLRHLPIRVYLERPTVLAVLVDVLDELEDGCARSMLQHWNKDRACRLQPEPNDSGAMPMKRSSSARFVMGRAFLAGSWDELYRGQLALREFHGGYINFVFQTYLSPHSRRPQDASQDLWG